MGCSFANAVLCCVMGELNTMFMHLVNTVFSIFLNTVFIIVFCV